jgi:predicted membrane-bound dolichyl-phosphate-mannose-protein mannosyltransferase
MQYKLTFRIFLLLTVLASAYLLSNKDRYSFYVTPTQETSAGIISSTTNKFDKWTGRVWYWKGGIKKEDRGWVEFK